MLCALCPHLTLVTVLAGPRRHHPGQGLTEVLWEAVMGLRVTAADIVLTTLILMLHLLSLPHTQSSP